MPKQTARDSRLVAGSDTIHRMAVSVGLGDVLTSQALWYFECSSNSATSQPVNDAWSAACLYLAIRMHQLPISTAQVAAAVEQDSRLILKLFQRVATACKITPPAVDFTNFTLHSMTKVPGVRPATKAKVLNMYVEIIAWLEKARPKTCVNNSWAAAACQHAMTFHKVEVEAQHLSKLFGSQEASFTGRVHELKQLLVAAAEGLPSSTYPECLAHISVLPVPPASGHDTDQGDNGDIDNTLEAMENTTSRASDQSLEGDVTAVLGTAAASACKGQLQRPATSATADVPQQAALPGAYAKLAVHDMVNMHDVPLPIKMQVLQLYVRLMVWLRQDTSTSNSYWAAAALQIAMLHYKIPFLPSNLAGHVKVDMLGEHAHEIRQRLTVVANSSCVSYSVCLHKIANMPCSLLPLLPDATQAAASGKVVQAANGRRSLDADASSQQQIQANLPAAVQSKVPVPALEASPGLIQPQHAAGSADTRTDGTKAIVQREPAPAADPAQQGVLPLATCAPTSTPIQPNLIPQAAPAAQGMAVTNSSKLRSQREAAALMTEEADLDGLHTADLDPGTVPHPPVLTPPASSQGPPAPAVRAQLPVALTSDAAMSDDSDLGLQKLQSGMLMSRVQVAEQAHRPMLLPVLHRLPHSSSEGNSAPSTADRLAQLEQPQAQIPVSGEQRSAPQLQNAAACLVSPLPAQGGFPMQQQQQPLAVLHGPAVQQLHKLLQQIESTAQTNASLALPAQPNEQLHAATVAGHAVDGRPVSWVRAAPSHSRQHQPQQAVPVSLPAAGNSDLSQRGPSPWVMLPGSLHAAIAVAMAQEGASPTSGGSPRAAHELSLVGPDGTQGRGVKRPRADSAARATSTGRPGDVGTVNGHAAHTLAPGPAAAQVNSASSLSTNTAGKCCSTMRLSSASEPAAAVQLGSNLRLADGGTAGSAQQFDSSSPADPTLTANLAVGAVPTQQVHSAPQSGSPAAGLDSPVQAASALRDDSPQAAKQAQLKVPASKKALSDLQEQHLNGEQGTHQGSPSLHEGFPSCLQPARSRAKRRRSEAALDVSMSGAEQNTDVELSRLATPLRGKSVGVDDMASPSSKLRRINEHEAQDALLLLHDHEPQQALQHQQGLGTLAA
ncbi:hypothetical protein WJX77_010295 [Trebouxia sp. C0004]